MSKEFTLIACCWWILQSSWWNLSFIGILSMCSFLGILFVFSKLHKYLIVTSEEFYGASRMASRLIHQILTTCIKWDFSQDAHFLKENYFIFYMLLHKLLICADPVAQFGFPCFESRLTAWPEGQTWKFIWRLDSLFNLHFPTFTYGTLFLSSWTARFVFVTGKQDDNI